MWALGSGYNAVECITAVEWNTGCVIYSIPPIDSVTVNINFLYLHNKWMPDEKIQTDHV